MVNNLGLCICLEGALVENKSASVWGEHWLKTKVGYQLKKKFGIFPKDFQKQVRNLTSLSITILRGIQCNHPIKKIGYMISIIDHFARYKM